MSVEHMLRDTSRARMIVAASCRHIYDGYRASQGKDQAGQRQQKEGKR